MEIALEWLLSMLRTIWLYHAKEVNVAGENLYLKLLVAVCSKKLKKLPIIGSVKEQMNERMK